MKQEADGNEGESDGQYQLHCPHWYIVGQHASADFFGKHEFNAAEDEKGANSSGYGAA